MVAVLQADGAGRVQPVRAVRPASARDQVVHRRERPRTPRSPRTAMFWRRRIVAAALGLGVLLTGAHAGAAALVGGSTTVSPERGRPHVVRVVVAPGDTLWSIAHRLAPHDDTRAVVDAIVAARGSAEVRAGDTITWLAS
jgi:LysM domain-containing protein